MVAGQFTIGSADYVLAKVGFHVRKSKESSYGRCGWSLEISFQRAANDDEHILVESTIFLMFFIQTNDHCRGDFETQFVLRSESLSGCLIR